MNEQEMQFADPEWRPPEDGMVQARQMAPEPYVPQPINREPAMWQTGASAPQSDVPPMPVQPRPYTGGYAPQPARSRQYGVPGRKSRSPWFLIIVILIGFSVMSGGLFSRGVDHGPGPRSDQGSLPWTQNDKPLQSFTVGNTPTIVIHGSFHGNIHVVAGNDANTVAVDSPINAGANYTSDNNTVTMNMSGFSDVTVTVPGNAILQIDTQSGDIDVQGVNGQMGLTSSSGTITVRQSTLTGQSILKSDSGSVSFNGSLDSNGSYQFESTSGNVDVTLPSNASFHADASTNAGSINSDFSSVAVQQVGSNGAQAHGDVGTQPRPVITLKTNNGNIYLHEGS